MEKYIKRCIKELKSWGAPIEGWKCTDITDAIDDGDGDFYTCELCGCSHIRYQHHMENVQYFEEVVVGCVCAGIMEGDILKAKERERLMKNRSGRRKNFIKKKWEKIGPITFKRTHRGKTIFISKEGGTYIVICDSEKTDTYKGKPITNMLTATYAAFDLADPKSEVMV